jgi:hypothetical protein
MSVNGDPAAYEVSLYGSGAASGASTFNSWSSFVNLGEGYISLTTDEFWNNEISIFDYAQTDKFKPGLNRTNKAASGGTLIQGFLYRTTSAITSLTIVPAYDSIATGSTFALYGVSA